LEQHAASIVAAIAVGRELEQTDHVVQVRVRVADDAVRVGSGLSWERWLKAGVELRRLAPGSAAHGAIESLELDADPQVEHVETGRLGGLLAVETTHHAVAELRVRSHVTILRDDHARSHARLGNLHKRAQSTLRATAHHAKIPPGCIFPGRSL
jgi:hypothetical protein